MIALDSGDKIQGDASVVTVVDYTIHGIDNNAIKQMADGQLPSSIGDLYTSDSTDAVSSIILVNTDSSARTVNLYITPNGGTARRIIPKNMSLGIDYCLITDGSKVNVYDASGKLLTTAAAATHDLGGASHNADTLSNLNSKISDATLVDAAQTAAEVDADILTHKNLASAHHAKYLDSAAVTAAKTVKLDDFATPDDNADLDFDTARHGLVPKGTNVGDFLKDDGTWGEAGGGLTFTELAGRENHNVSSTNTWEDWDLSGIVGAGAKVVLVQLRNDARSTYRDFGARKNGTALDRKTYSGISASHTVNLVIVMPTECDANRVIDIYCETSLSDFGIIGYWS